MVGGKAARTSFREEITATPRPSEKGIPSGIVVELTQCTTTRRIFGSVRNGTLRAETCAKVGHFGIISRRRKPTSTILMYETSMLYFASWGKNIALSKTSQSSKTIHVEC